MEPLMRMVEHLFGRLDGPLHFRFIIQPAMALLFAVVDGIRDARQGRSAYGWAVLTRPGSRGGLLKEGWARYGKIFLLAAVLDLVYQWKVFLRIYPGEAILVALLLAALPYLLMRGPANLVARRFVRRPPDQTVNRDSRNPL